MKCLSKKDVVLSALFSILFLLGVVMVNAQSTEFTYQGRLLDSSLPPTGSYDFQFALWDTLANGTQVGTTQTVSGVAVTGGIFSVKLDFGPTAFADGSARFLEIEVKPAAGGTFTTLAPRQSLTSAPHSIRSLSTAAADSLSAQCVSCVTTGQIQSLDGAQITGTIPVASIPPGSDNYIQNTSVPRNLRKDGGQPAASLNIGGNATVGSMDVNGPISMTAIAKPGAAPAGQGRIYFDSTASKIKVSENGGAFVDLVGAGGVSGSGAVDAIPLWSAGTTLGNSLISQVGGTDVNLPAFVNLAATASGNNIRFGTPNSGTGMSIQGPTTRADVRLDTNTLRLAVGAAGGPPGNGIGIDATTVSLPAFVNLAATASGNNIAFGSPNSGTGMTISGPSARADLRLDTTTLRLANGLGGVGPPGNGIAILTNGNVGIGTTNPTTTLQVSGTLKTSILQITAGSDLAENFEVSGTVKPGMIVAINPNNPEKLVLARGAYNRRVAGIVSGANNLSAGMVLPNLDQNAASLPVALSGRVWVYADATTNPIIAGDLLTSSATAGYAMKVTNFKRANGAVIGKALTGLKGGKGLVLVLVNLQ
ncbi:MAG: hypothetical protein ACKVRN_10825 [Pyrinomonadaceae bacterium]